MPQRQRERPSNGFTLIELMIVMIIIGILFALIMTAAMDGARRAEERATQGLITKLETGMSDRIEALLSQRAEENAAHAYIANFSPQRSAVIAQYDYMRAELPDTFLYDSTNSAYPVNFGGVAYDPNGTVISSAPSALSTMIGGVPLAAYILPLGNAMQDALGANNVANPAGTGIYGASYSARAAIYKNLGFSPQGFDGLDNDGNGLVDDTLGSENAAGALTTVQANLARHKPVTARSEMLYALLVEGQGPLGTVFRADDFTDKEVKDTDGDGLPEFVDAWGQPLQFYRWPILYHSDVQRGQRILTVDQVNLQVTFDLPYSSVFETREQDPLDPNQMLVAPAWWLNNTGRLFFESYFHTLSEPTTLTASNATGVNLWDRSTSTAFGSIYPRRAFYTKFLIASAGPDSQLGIYQAFTTQPSVTVNNIAHLMQEGYACQFVPADLTTAGTAVTASGSPSSVDLQNQGQDDITNHNVSAPGGGF
jgi:prepilin-type N-terminal cleavage/methylation domain-containing protein